MVIQIRHVSVFVGVTEVGLPLMGYTVGINMRAHLLTYFLAKYVNTHFTILLKHLNGNKVNSHPKCFKTTNFDRFYREGAGHEI